MTRIQLDGDSIHHLLHTTKIDSKIDLNFRTFIDNNTQLEKMAEIVNKNNLLFWCYSIDDANKLAEFNIISRYEKDFSNTSKYEKLKNLSYSILMDKICIKGFGEYLNGCITKTTNLRILYDKDTETKDLYDFFKLVVNDKNYTYRYNSVLLYSSILTIPYQSLDDLAQTSFNIWTNFDNLGYFVIDNFMIEKVLDN